MNKKLSTSVLCAVAIALISAPARAQTVATLTRDGSFPEGLAFVSGVRELADGRVIVADPLGRVVLRLDLAAGTADTLGRVGQGPGEYRQPDQVFALPGDSTLLVDLGNGRLAVIGPDGSFAGTMPITQRDPTGDGVFTSILPKSVDGSGKIYFQPSSFGAQESVAADSAPVCRFDRATGQIDTLVTVKTRERRSSTRSQGGGVARIVRPVPLSPQDDWAVGVDGRLAVVRSLDYHVDWVLADGRIVSGAPVDYRPVRIRRGEQEEWMADEGASGLNYNWNNNDGKISITYARGLSSGQGLDPDRFDWPDVMPPFRAGRTHVSPLGDVWVERSVPAGSETMIDIFDSRGSRKGSIALPAGRHVVGFGDNTVYVKHADEFDLIWLERFKIDYE